MALRQALKDAGVKNPVRRVDDGDKVIAYIKGEKQYEDRKKYPFPEILLLDLKMPRISGFQVMEWINGTRFKGDFLIVILSGHGELENVRVAYQLGARSFLTKPCQAEDVQNLVGAYPKFWEVKTPKTKPVGKSIDGRLTF